MYSAYYAQLGKDVNSLGVAIAFSVLTSLALTSLFESIAQMEDPFVGAIGLDGIDVTTEMFSEFKQELLDYRSLFYPDAAPFEMDRKVVLVPQPNEPELRFLQTSI